MILFDRFKDLSDFHGIKTICNQRTVLPLLITRIPVWYTQAVRIKCSFINFIDLWRKVPVKDCSSIWEPSIPKSCEKWCKEDLKTSKTTLIDTFQKGPIAYVLVYLWSFLRSGSSLIVQKRIPTEILQLYNPFAPCNVPLNLPWVYKMETYKIGDHVVIKCH